MEKQVIVIIGGGSTGLSTAINLTRQSNHKIIVLEKSFVGSGQTGQCCGFVRTFYNVREMAYSAYESRNQIKKLHRKNSSLEFVKKGLLVINSIKKSGKIKNNVRMLKSLGIKTKYLEGKEINKINPYLITKNVCAGYDEDAGYINPKLVVDYLEKECDRLGVKISEQTKVLGLKKNSDKFILKTNKGDIKADKVFNATAAFTNKINSMLDFSLPIKVIKTNNCFYRLPMGPQRYLTAVADFINLFYIIPHKEFIDVSTISLDLKKEINPENNEDLNFDGETVNQYLGLISKRVKGANKSIKLGGFSSCLDVSPDYYPILGKTEKIPNYYFASGFSGTGFKHFPVIGKLMAEIILEKKPTLPELASFLKYDRFKLKQTRKGVTGSYFVKNK